MADQTAMIAFPERAMATSRWRVPALLALSTTLLASVCPTGSSSTIPFGFTMKLSTFAIDIPVGQAGTDTLTVTSVGSFSGLVTLTWESPAANCTITPSAVDLPTGGSMKAVTSCSLAVPDATTVQFMASALGYQNAYATLTLLQQ